MANLRSGLWAPACTGVVTSLAIWVIPANFRDFPSALWMTLQERSTSAGHRRGWAQALAGWGACGHIVSHYAQSDVWKEALGCTKVFKLSSFTVTWTRACMSVYVNNQGNREVHTQVQAQRCTVVISHILYLSPVLAAALLYHWKLFSLLSVEQKCLNLTEDIYHLSITYYL